MTHDKTTFKELLTRIASLGQSNISLFSSKEQEQEQRALLLKALCYHLNIFFEGLYQCFGSKSGSTGSTCFWASRIRIH
jgi:hypothetical protein